MFGIFGNKRSYDEIIQSIQNKRRSNGDAALSEGERRLYEGHVFEAYFYHHGGFDYYLSQVDDLERWAQTIGALIFIGRDDVTPIFHEAVKIYTTFDPGAADQETTKAYLAQIKETDARFRASLPDLEARLQEYAQKI